eukprot:2667097-Rhodomonas_salina.1
MGKSAKDGSRIPTALAPEAGRPLYFSSSAFQPFRSPRPHPLLPEALQAPENPDNCRKLVPPVLMPPAAVLAAAVAMQQGDLQSLLQPLSSLNALQLAQAGSQILPTLAQMEQPADTGRMDGFLNSLFSPSEDIVLVETLCKYKRIIVDCSDDMWSSIVTEVVSDSRVLPLPGKGTKTPEQWRSRWDLIWNMYKQWHCFMWHVESRCVGSVPSEMKKEHEARRASIPGFDIMQRFEMYNSPPSTTVPVVPQQLLVDQAGDKAQDRAPNASINHDEGATEGDESDDENDFTEKDPARDTSSSSRSAIAQASHSASADAERPLQDNAAHAESNEPRPQQPASAPPGRKRKGQDDLAKAHPGDLQPGDGPRKHGGRREGAGRKTNERRAEVSAEAFMREIKAENARTEEMMRGMQQENVRISSNLNILRLAMEARVPSPRSRERNMNVLSDPDILILRLPGTCSGTASVLSSDALLHAGDRSQEHRGARASDGRLDENCGQARPEPEVITKTDWLTR